MMRFKCKGVTIAATAIAIIAWMFLGYIAFIVMASPFSVLASARTARQAEQYAEFVASSLRLMSYDELDTAAHDRRSLVGEIADAADWESSVTLSDERHFGDDAENVQRIATVDIFRTGDTLSRYTLQVPLSSASDGVDKLPIGTILPYVGAIKDIPKGWALCDGLNGTPNLTGRFLEGVTNVTSTKSFKSAGLPNITGNSMVPFQTSGEHYGTFQNGALQSFYERTGLWYGLENWIISYYRVNLNASLCNPIYGNSSTVQPASYTVMYIIKIK